MDFRLVNKTHSNGQIHFDIVDASSALHVTIVANECVHICLLPALMTSTVYDGSNQNHINIVRYSLICHTPAFRLSIHFFHSILQRHYTFPAIFHVVIKSEK